MSIPSWAKPGVKVVCVNATGPDWWGISTSWRAGEAPRERAVYTIARAWMDSDGAPVAEFHELARSDEAHSFWGEHVGYWLGRFRPLVADKSEAEDVALFRQHLEQRAPEGADA